MVKKFNFGTGGGSGDTESPSIDFNDIAGDPSDIGNNGDNGGGSADNGSDIGSGSGKRGRKPRDPNAPKLERKPRSKPSAEAYKNGIETLSNLLLVVHSGVAIQFNAPELSITQEESKMLATASAELMAQFDIAPDPKVAAVVGFVMVAGSIYGPRALQIRNRVKREGKPVKNKLGLHDNVVPLNETTG